MISWAVAFGFALIAIASGVSATIVAAVEPGAERIAASAFAAIGFLALVFGLVRSGQDARVLLVQRLLAFLSRSRFRSAAAASGFFVLSCLCWRYGAGRTGSLLVSCRDANHISRRTMLGRRLEECGASGQAYFGAWYPFGRDEFVNDILCEYKSGDEAPLLRVASLSCPVHHFTYVRLYDEKKLIFTWSRGLDRRWQEHSSENGTYSPYEELGIQEQDVPDPAMKGRLRLTGLVVQRIPDYGGMQLLLPFDLSTTSWVYLRDTPRDDWRLQGIVNGIP